MALKAEVRSMIVNEKSRYKQAERNLDETRLILFWNFPGRLEHVIKILTVDFIF
jgi:hypothetical protein